MAAPDLARACASWLRCADTGSDHAEVIRQLQAFAQGTPATFVTSWRGRTGAVTPQAGDYTAGMVGADVAGAAAAAYAAVIALVGTADGIAGLNASSQISDATHGARSGGSLHATATPDPGGTAGFMSPVDKAKLDALVPTEPAGTGWLYGLGFDGARVIPAGTAAALTAPVNYTDLTLQANAILPAAAQPIDVSGTLTFGSGAYIHVDGNNGVGTTGGAATAAGSLAQAGIAGANGGIGNSAGGNASSLGVVSTALGGNGGAGGGGNGGQPGGNAGVAVRPVASTVGRWDQANGFFFNYTTSGFTRPRGGASGGGGGGSINGSGGGAGSGASVGQVRAKDIVMEAGAIGFRAKGGDGAAVAVALSGGGGGGGGGSFDVFCDSWTMPPGANYEDFFDVSGGTGGAAVTPGNAGANGVAGKARLFIRGVLEYETPLPEETRMSVYDQLKQAAEGYLREAPTGDALSNVIRSLSALGSGLVLFAAAPLLFVAKNGNDTNTGTYLDPFLTVQAAVTAAPTGAKIIVCPGVYQENVVLRAAVDVAIEGLGLVVISPAAGIPVAGAPTGARLWTLTNLALVANVAGPSLSIVGNPEANDAILAANDVLLDGAGNPQGVVTGINLLNARNCSGSWRSLNCNGGSFENQLDSLTISVENPTPAGVVPTQNRVSSGRLAGLEATGNAIVICDKAVDASILNIDAGDDLNFQFTGRSDEVTLQCDLPTAIVDFSQANIGDLDATCNVATDFTILARGTQFGQVALAAPGAGEVVLDNTGGGQIKDTSGSNMTGLAYHDRDGGGDVVTLDPGVNVLGFGTELQGFEYPPLIIPAFVVSPNLQGSLAGEVLGVTSVGSVGCQVTSGFPGPQDGYVVYRRPYD
jgi:hypothetical protein